MTSRLNLSYVTFALIGFGLLACGGDERSSDTGASTASASAGRSGTGPSRAGASGSSPGQGLFRTQMCPMTEAEATGSCTPARGSCTFGTRVCDCIEETMAWACWSPSDCPTAAPPERSACSVVGMTCEPAGSDCTCTAQGWDCGNQYCPPAEPALGSACEGGAGLCPYGARSCDCDNSVWACWSPATDCPSPPPPDRSACALDGVICEYEGGSCECNGTSGWRCGRGVMNDTEDAGVPPVTGTAGVGASAGSGAGASATSGGRAGDATSGTGGVVSTQAGAGAAATTTAGAGGSTP